TGSLEPNGTSQSPAMRSSKRGSATPWTRWELMYPKRWPSASVTTLAGKPRIPSNGARLTKVRKASGEVLPRARCCSDSCCNQEWVISHRRLHQLRSMSSIKRDVKEKRRASTGTKTLFRDPATVGSPLWRRWLLSFLVSFSADDDDAIEFARGASATGVSV